jgi:hypothetical protein
MVAPRAETTAYVLGQLPTVETSTKKDLIKPYFCFDIPKNKNTTQNQMEIISKKRKNSNKIRGSGQWRIEIKPRSSNNHFN